MTTVETVRGPVPVEDLGPTLAHEHLISISSEFERYYPELAWSGERRTRVEHVAATLEEVRLRGIGAVLDCTAFFHGRDMDFVRDVNERVDLHVIVSTGLYTFDYLPYHLYHRAPGPAADDVLSRMFLRDITIGIGDSGVRAQSIKVGTDVQGVTPNNERILRAAGFVSGETGAPITVHTHPADRNATRIQEILAGEGADLTRVVIGHAGDSTDLDYLRSLIRGGSVIGADRFGLYRPGTPGLDERVEVIAELCADGHADRIVLSHDTVMYSDWGPPGTAVARYPTWVPTHLSDEVLPAMRRRGIAEPDIDTMLRATPASLFSGLA